MLYCTKDTEEEAKGTGVHVLENYNKGKLGEVCEIGKYTRKKNPWEETIGNDTQKQKRTADPQPSQNPPDPPESSAPTEANRTAGQLTQGTQERQVELMEPQDFHQSIFDLQLPPRSSMGSQGQEQLQTPCHRSATQCEALATTTQSMVTEAMPPQ